MHLQASLIFLDAETAPGQISFSKRPSSKTYRKGKRSIMNENTVQLPPGISHPHGRNAWQRILRLPRQFLCSPYLRSSRKHFQDHLQGFRKTGSFFHQINSMDQKRLFLRGRCPSIQMSLLSGRSLLSPGAKRHDPCIPHSD